MRWFTPSTVGPPLRPEVPARRRRGYLASGGLIYPPERLVGALMERLYARQPTAPLTPREASPRAPASTDTGPRAAFAGT
jgi:hypothetical protein